MALVYYRDNAYAPVPTGDAYATLAKVDPLLAFHAKWQYLDATMKEDAIKAATAQIDIMSFTGAMADVAQPLQFPREYGETEGPFSRQAQDRKLVQALASQIEFNLNRTGIGQTSYSHGNESISPRQEIVCREAIGALDAYIEG